MKAWVLHAVNDIRLEDIKKPEASPGEVIVKVKAAGVCGSDIPRIYKTGAHNMPLIPGHEFSGIVDSLGEGVEDNLLGKRVAVFPLIPCGVCDSCKKLKPQLCRNYDYIGSRRDGAFAEYVRVPAENLMEVPDNVSFEEAAMLEPMAVAVHAIRQGMESFGAEMPLDKNFVICGAGTIGLILAMFLKAKGVRKLFFIGNKDSQKNRVYGLGISEENFCDKRISDPVEWLKERGGSDFYLEAVGRNESLSYGVETMNPGARIVAVGNPYSDMTLSRETYWKILRNEGFITGTWNSVFLPNDNAGDDWHYVRDYLAAAKVQPSGLISHKFPIAELEKGFKIMRDKSEDYCKVMLIV